MIKEVKNVEDANKCDELLTKLILDERKYNDLIDNNIVIKNHFSKMLDDEDAILLAYYLDKLIVGYILIRKINEINKNIKSWNKKYSSFLFIIRKVASPHVQIASQSHGLRKLNLVIYVKIFDFSYIIKK